MPPCGQGSRGRVECLIRRHRIHALAVHRFRSCTIDSGHYLLIAPNLLAQSFVGAAPNTIWFANITSTATGESWLYLASQRQYPAAGLVCHSDREWQYAAGADVDYPSVIPAAFSTSRTDNCYDNAPMESFLPHTEGRTGPSMPTGNPDVSLTGAVRIHRRLSQPASDATGLQYPPQASRPADDRRIQRVRRYGKRICEQPMINSRSTCGIVYTSINLRWDFPRISLTRR